MTPDLIYDQIIGMGLARQAEVLLGRQSRRRVAAPVSRRGRERLAEPAGDRGALARGDGQRVRGGRGRSALRGVSRLCRRRSAEGQSDIRSVDCPYTGEVLADGSGDPARRRHHPCPARRSRGQRAARRASSACRRRRCSPPQRSVVTVEEIVEDFDAAGPNAVILPHWTVTAIAVVARRRLSHPMRTAITSATTPSTSPGTRSRAIARAFWPG